jgi:8-oxo-dGTP diphosphatase
MNYTVYKLPPSDFLATVEVAGCFIALHDRLLYLKRASTSPQGGTWSIPAGKLEKGETPQQAVIREISEEVGLDISQDVEVVGTLYIQLDKLSYVFHMFTKAYTDLPTLTLDVQENVEARWLTFEEIVELPLIAGGKEALLYFQAHGMLASKE